MNRASLPPAQPKPSLRNLSDFLSGLFCLTAVCLPAIAQNPSLVGSWPGYDRRDLHALAVSGNHLFAAGWNGGLQIIDISNLAAPVPVGGFNPNGALPYPQATADAVAVAGNHAYVVFGQSAGRKGLHVVDFSDPRTPVGTGWLYRSTACVDVAVAGNLVCVAAEGAGLLIADVSNPDAPVAMGTFNTSGTARGVAVVGQLAYVADGSAGLQVVDISNPSAPVRVGGFNTSGEAYDVAIGGHHAYVADGLSGLQVIDVSSPAAPVRVGGYNSPGEAFGVAVSGQQAYLADGAPGLRILDVSDPAAPIPVGRIGPPTHEEPSVPPEEMKARNVAVAGNHAFVGHVNAGIDFINISNPAAPRRDGYHGVGQTRSVARAGGHLYVADRYWLHVLDLTNPAVPKRIGGLFERTSDRRSSHLTIAFDHAYFAGGPKGIGIIDVSDPSKPRLVRRYGEGNEFAEITIQGRHAYARAYQSSTTTLQILDLANPGDPILRGVYNPGGFSRGRLRFSGHHAYVGAQNGLHVVDVSNPTSPVLVGRIDLGSNPVIAGMVGAGLLCVGQNFPTFTSTLHVIDLSDPASPRSVKRLAFPQPIIDATVAGDFVLMTFSDNGGVRVIEINDPLQPAVRWTIPAPANSGFNPAELAVSGEYAYFANGYSGVAVARLPALAPPSLGISRLGGDSLLVSWPLSAAGFGLEQTMELSGSLGSAVWSPVLLPLETNAPHVSITVPRSAGTTLYRLRKP